MRLALGGIALTALAISSFSVAAADDRDFLTEAMKGDNSEVVLGQLAASKGTTEGVRTFGKKLAVDHSKAKKQVLAVARQLNVQETNALSDEASAEKARLDTLSGAAFDKEFAAFMVKDHESDIQKFEKQANKGTGPTADLAKQTLPELRKHLDIARSLVR
jgi:putative membrane protein